MAGMWGVVMVVHAPVWAHVPTHAVARAERQVSYSIALSLVTGSLTELKVACFG